MYTLRVSLADNHCDGDDKLVMYSADEYNQPRFT